MSSIGAALRAVNKDVANLLEPLNIESPRPSKQLADPGAPTAKRLGRSTQAFAAAPSSMQADVVGRLGSRLKPEDFCHGRLERV